MKLGSDRYRERAAPLCALLLSAAAAAADDVTLSAGGREALAYRPAPSPNKVYVSRLHAPSGAQVLLDAPADHVHHHGLMLGLDVEGVSFWLDGQERGTQRPRGAPKVEGGTLAQTLDWVTSDGRALLVEERSITAHAVPDDAHTLVTWRSRLTPAPGLAQVSLATKLHYSGLGLRLPKSMDGKASFAFLGEVAGGGTAVRNSERVTQADGVACCGPLADGRRVTVAMFARPGDGATHWFTMSDALTYLSATKNQYRSLLTIQDGEALTFEYGVAVWDGAADAPAVARARGVWVQAISESGAPQSGAPDDRRRDR